MNAMKEIEAEKSELYKQTETLQSNLQVQKVKHIRNYYMYMYMYLPHYWGEPTYWTECIRYRSNAFIHFMTKFN